MTFATTALTGAVRTYQWTIRSLIGPNCRFDPGCSDYAVQAITTHGALHGSALAARRLLRCHPWCEGGFDPVPPAATHPVSPQPNPSSSQDRRVCCAMATHQPNPSKHQSES